MPIMDDIVGSYHKYGAHDLGSEKSKGSLGGLKTIAGI
jgi:hypothetical protein